VFKKPASIIKKRQFKEVNKKLDVFGRDESNIDSTVTLDFASDNFKKPRKKRVSKPEDKKPTKYESNRRQFDKIRR
jgi:hypothetical protein